MGQSIDKELVSWMESVGFEVCNTPIRSPESNGVSEAVNRWIRADYIKQDACVSFNDVESKIPYWIKDYNTMCPHERLGGATAVEYYEEWLKILAKKCYIINWCYPIGYPRLGIDCFKTYNSINDYRILIEVNQGNSPAYSSKLLRQCIFSGLL